jgi:hypothetical protein
VSFFRLGSVPLPRNKNTQVPAPAQPPPAPLSLARQARARSSHPRRLRAPILCPVQRVPAHEQFKMKSSPPSTHLSLTRDFLDRYVSNESSPLDIASSLEDHSSRHGYFYRPFTEKEQTKKDGDKGLPPPSAEAWEPQVRGWVATRDARPRGGHARARGDLHVLAVARVARRRPRQQERRETLGCARAFACPTVFPPLPSPLPPFPLRRSPASARMSRRSPTPSARA